MSESATESRPLWEAHVAHLANRRTLQGQPETVIMPHEHVQEQADHHTTEVDASVAQAVQPAAAPASAAVAQAGKHVVVL